MRKYIITYQMRGNGEIIQTEKFSQFDIIVEQSAREVAKKNHMVVIGIYKQLDFES